LARAAFGVVVVLVFLVVDLAMLVSFAGPPGSAWRTWSRFRGLNASGIPVVSRKFRAQLSHSGRR
jgi:hypothetical protein